MTRETRIGLLVGLGFIVMFGLVLTELTGTGRPVAPPVSVEETAELALAPAEDISPVVVHPQDAPPRLGAPVRPASAAALMAAGADAPPQAAAPAEPPPPEVVAVVHRSETAAPAADRTAAPTALASPRITRAAELTAPPTVEPAPPLASAAPPAAARTYTVQPGDSLIRIARRVYGDDHPNGYKRILEANRDQVPDPSLVRVGQVLVIPEPTGPARAVAAARPRVREVELGQLAEALGSAPGESPQPRTPGTLYVVQRGDTLTKIARQTLNTDSRAAVMSIYHANQSKLSDPDRLPVGAELVIPL